MNYPEVLAPAGDMEKLRLVIQYGADAVYLASRQFGMRASAKNFSEEELKEAVDYAHERGVRVYLTCNVLLENNEISELEEALVNWQKSGVDAIIVSDIGALMLARRVVPEMEIHISTQAGVTNYLTATELYHLGAKRVVLAREVPLEDIKKIRDNTPADLEIEAFVHGAMCVSFSGRCLISQYLTGRDANHGECAQSCRWKYHLVEEKRPGEYMPVVEDEKGTHFFNAKDMCMLEYLDQLAKAGISSFKIEGRAKSAFYGAAVTNAYRIATDIYKANPDNYILPEWLSQEPYKVSHREYSTGFYFPEQPAGQVYHNAGYIREWEVTAIVEAYQNGEIICTQRNKFEVGETLEVLEPGTQPREFVVTRIINSKDEEVDSAPHPMETLRIPFSTPVQKGALIRKQL